ncbi:MAG TPA: hypothetical protein VJ783_30410 [Pirellulales bacterium]|nr:hypothetical protein [Pirellulales bacterium]
MRFTTIIPIRRNKGPKVGAAELQAIYDMLTAKFGGMTQEGQTQGQWIDLKDGKIYRDHGRKVTVVCDNERLVEAESIVRKIGRQLGQKAMYFEVRDFDGVRFLRIRD